MIEWLIQHNNDLVLLNLGWYCLLALAFSVGGHWPKALYFLGATILTLGVWLMK